MHIQYMRCQGARVSETFSEDVVEALRRLAELYPEQQERALILRVSQSTVSRYDADIKMGRAPSGVTVAGLQAIVRAIELAEGKRPDLALGLTIALREAEEMVARLRAMLPAGSKTLGAGSGAVGGADEIATLRAAEAPPSDESTPRKRKRSGGSGGSRG